MLTKEASSHASLTHLNKFVRTREDASFVSMTVKR